ncbi:hypothetical protein LINPERPRIM_LOCUS41287 [Linum perenne]
MESGQTEELHRGSGADQSASL